MSVAEHGQAIRIQFEYKVQRFVKRRPRLLRQTINQVGVDAFETQRPRHFEYLASFFVRLNSPHRQLNVPVEILDTYTQSVEAERSQRTKLIACCHPWVDLDGELSVCRQMEA